MFLIRLIAIIAIVYFAYVFVSGGLQVAGVLLGQTFSWMLPNGYPP